MSTKYIKIGMSSCGIAAGAEEIYKTLLNKHPDVEIKKVGCLGMCWAEPLIEVNINDNPPVLYRNVNKETALRILENEHFPELVIDENQELKNQKRIVLRNCGKIDPESIDDYIENNGYQAIKKAKEVDVIDEIKKSGLRGRGGAGFPTWLKWKATRDINADQKYIICNGDEGDPGAYMDRSVLESDPHSVLEGMMIAGYATGASQGYFYIRAEYPLAVDRVQKAIDQCYERGLLGDNFDIEIRIGAGAFVCGEETALIASIEGKRGYPRPRPPFPAYQGLWDKPTIINNVETLANVPYIILNGGDSYASIGTEKSKGTKVFALTGKVKKSGLAEVPMGTTLREIIDETGGGILEDKMFKAVQTGGPSGGMIPKDFLDTPISYESLEALGSIMGSGGMIVMDEDNCAVDVAKFFTKFCMEESCGKCAPCRIGTKQLHRILEKICNGEATEDDLPKIKRLCHSMQQASLCGLGQTAPNPVLSSIRYFENEYLEHIKEKKCHAGKCFNKRNTSPG